MPYGDLDRLHYDVLGNSHRKMALNALKRTDHEPIHRIVIIEEVWPKSTTCRIESGECDLTNQKIR